MNVGDKNSITDKSAGIKCRYIYINVYIYIYIVNSYVNVCFVSN